MKLRITTMYLYYTTFRLLYFFIFLREQLNFFFHSLWRGSPPLVPAYACLHPPLNLQAEQDGGYMVFCGCFGADYYCYVKIIRHVYLWFYPVAMLYAGDSAKFSASSPI